MMAPSGNRVTSIGEYVVLKSKVRVLMLAALAVMVVGGVAASSASAVTSWNVRGAALGAGASEGITATFLTIGTTGLVAILKTKLPGGKITIEISCKTAALVGAKITGLKGGSATRISFKGCKLDSKECKLTSAETTEISTSEVSAETTDLSGVEPLYLKVFPKIAGGSFTSISLTACAGEGKFEVTGTAACAAAVKATTEQPLHLCKFETFPLVTTLKFGTEPASIEGGASVTLVNGGNWSSTL
jgi:hypothetical protein